MSNKAVSAPTVESNPILSLSKSAIFLRKALKKKEPDEEAIIIILTSCSNEQRHEISKAYYVEFKRNLEKDLRRRLCKNLESLIVGLIYPPKDYFTRQLNKALKGLDVDANTIIEILVTHTNEEIHAIVECYQKAFNLSLVEHLRSKTSGDFKKLLTLLVTKPVMIETETSVQKAQQLAEEIIVSEAANNPIQTAELFVNIFAHENYRQLRLLFEQYAELSGNSIKETLKSKLSGNLLKLTVAMVEYIQNPITYFAKQLNRALSGAKIDDQTLIRILITRSEIDLVAIKKEYKRMFEKSLKSDIREATSGSYRKALLHLIGGSY